MTINIPGQSKKHSVSNASDLFGTIQYGKNINLDESGYIKLSSRAISIFAENDGTNTNLRLPTAFGRGTLSTDSVDFAITQSGQKGYWLTLLENGITLNVDSGLNAPTFTTDSHGAWFQNLWNVTSDIELFTKAGLADSETYTAKSASIATGKVHVAEVFKDRVTICITNGNTIKQFASDYSASTTLTIPADFEAVGLSYSNGKMAIITVLSDTATGKNQNQDSQFFVWNGSSTSAAPGIPIGTDKAIAIAPYKGSWVILTRLGQLRFFTGGGWQDIGALPFYYKNLIWGQAFTRDILGNAMITEGDLILINVNALFNASGKNYEQFSHTNIGGILCFDPAIGIYSRYTPSISPASLLTVTSGNINTTTNVLTKTAGTIPSTGSPIKYVYDKTSQIGGLQTPTVYYCIKLTSSTFSLATTKEKALSGVAIDITSTGASNNYFLGLEVYDYGQSYANSSGAIAQMGKVTAVYDHLIFGAELNDYNGTGNSNHLNVTISDFENRGYFVTPLITSEELRDSYNKIHIFYRPLKTNDKIIVKGKRKELIGLPVSTPQARSSAVNQCAWNSPNSFSTTADLSDALTAYTAHEELECEVIAGAGAGTLTKISSITYSTGVYAVMLSENVDGANSGRYCDVVIENWVNLGTITSADTDGYKTIAVGDKFNNCTVEFKIEMRGSDVAIRNQSIINKTHTPKA